MINYGIKYGIITNNLECQFGLHHCDGLVETIEMNLSFDNFGVGMQKILWDADVIMTSTPQHPYYERTGNDGRPPSGASPLAAGPHRVNEQEQIWGRVQRPASSHTAPARWLHGPFRITPDARAPSCAGSARQGQMAPAGWPGGGRFPSLARLRPFSCCSAYRSPG
jgi:hypothetical protein